MNSWSSHACKPTPNSPFSVCMSTFPNPTMDTHCRGASQSDRLPCARTPPILHSRRAPPQAIQSVVQGTPHNSTGDHRGGSERYPPTDSRQETPAHEHPNHNDQPHPHTHDLPPAESTIVANVQHVPALHKDRWNVSETQRGPAQKR